MPVITTYDRAATSLSMACIVHCLALPMVAVGLPFVATLAQAEWIHWLLAVLTVLASGSVAIRARSARTPAFLVPAGLGITLVVAAFFAEEFEIDETLPTVVGASLIAIAHLNRLLRHR